MISVFRDTKVRKLYPIPVASDRYVKELDGIRAIAILVVVSAHYHLVPVPGGFGVTLFFFLSGYLITTLFFAEYYSDRNIGICKFYLRRWLRLTPPLVISVIIGVVFYPVSRNFVGGTQVPLGTTMAALLYYTNYYDLYCGMEPSKVIPFGICWSLAVEEHFYLIWPLLIKTVIKNTSQLLVIIFSALVAILMWRIVAHIVLSVSIDYTGMATDSRIDSILYGSLLRVLLETRWASLVARFCKAPVSRISGLLVLIITFSIPNEAFRETIRYSLQGLALMPLFSVILLDQPTTIVRRALSTPAMVLIGKLSYSIYLFHLIARTPAEVVFGSGYGIESVVSGLIVTALLAYSVYVFVEKPIAKIRRQLREKKADPPPATSIEREAGSVKSAWSDHGVQNSPGPSGHT
jgi:peptidoglycan/LPS O-acetylase OafA/YrhL